MIRSLSAVVGLALVFVTLSQVGCTTPWKESYEAIAPLSYPPTDSVTIRRVPYARLNEAFDQLGAEVAESDTHPDEWPTARHAARKERLLRALQISEDPGNCTIIGRSVFRSTRDIRPDDGTLASFAERLGANYAVWSSAYVGKTEVIEREPITVTGYNWSGSRDRYGRYDDRTFHETAYVPVVVTADEFNWIVYYIRID